MRDALEFALAAFAAWRLAYLVAAEDGPFSLTLHLRSWFGAYDLDAKGTPRSWAGRGIVCVYCVSFWMGILCGLPLALRGYWLAPFAVSGAALLVHRWIRRE